MRLIYFHLLIVFSLLLALSFSSCANAIFGKTTAASPEEIFEDIWQNVNEKYPFFSYKNVDWDSIKLAYQPLIKPTMDDDELFKILAGMLNELKDGHVNIRAPFDRSRYWDWYLEEPINFNFDVLERKYLKEKGYKIAGPFLYAQFDSIGYLYYGSFSSSYTEKNLQAVFDSFKNTKGLIFDLRHNGGGRLSAMNDLVSRFADEKRQVASYIFKNKEGREQFFDTIPVFNAPHSKSRYKKPLIVLINRKSYSASTFFSSATKAFPHIQTMGDSTGGGGGVPTYFESKNGWSYRFSATITLDINGNNIENGVAPDIPIAMEEMDVIEGRDRILEKAIEVLTQSKKKEKTD